jgi:hypothetical protein
LGKANFEQIQITHENGSGQNISFKFAVTATSLNPNMKMERRKKVVGPQNRNDSLPDEASWC